MMHVLYKQEKIDVLFAGASSAYRHYDPSIWDNELDMNTFNCGSSNQRPEGTYYLLRDVFHHYNPKIVIYSISAAVFMEYDDWENPTKDYIVFDYLPCSFSKLQYGVEVFEKDFASAFLKFARNRNKDCLQTINKVMAIKNRTEYKTYDRNVYDNGEEMLNAKGFVSRSQGFEKGKVGHLEPIQFRDYQVRQVDVDYMFKLAELCQENNCTLIIVVPPMHYGSMVSYYNYQDIVDFNKGIASAINAPIFDFSLAKYSFLEMKDSFYYDWAHMSKEGADYFSKSCAKIINQFLSGQDIDLDDYFYLSYILWGKENRNNLALCYWRC